MAIMTAAAAVVADRQRRLRCSAGARQVAGGGWRAAGGSVFIIHCLFKAKNQRSIVRSVESRKYFFMYVKYYHALTLKKYARIFNSCDFWHTFSCRPFLFHSFTL
jgi:hypothetical protein